MITSNAVTFSTSFSGIFSLPLQLLRMARTVCIIGMCLCMHALTTKPLMTKLVQGVQRFGGSSIQHSKKKYFLFVGVFVTEWDMN